MHILLPRNRTDQISAVLATLSVAFPWAKEGLSAINRSGKDGISITIEPIKPSRSRVQENYYRKHCAEFAKFCGMTPDEMHEEMLCQCYGSEEVPTSFGMRRRPVKRSGQASRSDYSELVDTMIRIAAEMGYQIPPSD